MGVSGGPNILGDQNLVFIYDTGDSNSYVGQPTTNLITDPDGNANIITTDVPFGVNVIGYAQYSSGYYVNPRNTTSTLATGNTFTYSVYMRSQSSPKSTYLMYVYTGTGPDGGWWYFGDGSLTSDWRRYTYTRSDLTGTVSVVTVYRYNQQGIIDIAAPQIEIKPHATQFTKGTRSNTQGLLDISGYNNSISLASVSFDSNAQMAFDGTDDTILIPSSPSNNIAGDITLELILKRNSGTQGVPIHKEVQYTIYIYSDGSITYADSSLWSYSTFGAHGTAMTPNVFHHVVATKSGSLVTIYIDGNVIISKNFGSAITQTNNNLCIGSYAGSSGFFAGSIPISRIYNRALTAGEVLNNFNQLKSKFNM